MTRPRKEVVDYIPHYLARGKTIPVLEKRFGNDGYAFWWKILEILGFSEGHFFDCNNMANWEYLLTYTLVSEDIAVNILDLLAGLDAIDPDLWKRKVIWSGNLVENLKPLYSRRTSKPPTKEDICQRLSLSPIVSVCNNPPEKDNCLHDVDKNPSDFPQVEESRVEERNTLARQDARECKKAFDIFWSVYPKKKAKEVALKAWNKAFKESGFDLNTVLESLKKQLKSSDWLKDNGQFIPYPATWINGKRWLDDVSSKGNGSNKPPGFSDEDWKFWQYFRNGGFVGTEEQCIRYAELDKIYKTTGEKLHAIN